MILQQNDVASVSAISVLLVIVSESVTKYLIVDSFIFPLATDSGQHLPSMFCLSIITYDLQD